MKAILLLLLILSFISCRPENTHIVEFEYDSNSDYYIWTDKYFVLTAQGVDSMIARLEKQCQIASDSVFQIISVRFNSIDSSGHLVFSDKAAAFNVSELQQLYSNKLIYNSGKLYFLYKIKDAFKSGKSRPQYQKKGL